VVPDVLGVFRGRFWGKAEGLGGGIYVAVVVVSRFHSWVCGY
jgi:hypothetical protein